MKPEVIELRASEDGVRARILPRADVPPGITSYTGRTLAAASLNGAEPGSFAERVTARRVDLVQLIRDGLPPVEYLPESDGMLVKGKRHLIAAPRKEGKSIAMLVHWVRMALAGARVIVFDRENGAETYAKRLDSIIGAWGLGKPDERKLRHNLDYYEFPQLRKGDGEAFAKLADGAAVVVFDAQRMYLTDLGLREGEADDYSIFMAAVIDPLFRAGVATVILDNTGHSDTGRSRGSSAKGDLNEVLFKFKAESDFSVHRRGKVRLILEAGNSRFGNEGTWEMQIGAGAFTDWQRVDQVRPDDPAFRSTAIAVLRAAGTEGLSMTKLLGAIRERGVKVANKSARVWLYDYDADSAVPIRVFQEPGGRRTARFYYTGEVPE
jgi:hypothetical protein